MIRNTDLSVIEDLEVNEADRGGIGLRAEQRAADGFLWTVYSE